MFNIVSITTPDNQPSILLDVKNKVIGIRSPMGPAGSEYILAFPGLGYMSLVDTGSAVQGPGDWAVKVSGSSTQWTYRGGGQAQINVNASGGFEISGGANTIKGQLIAWQL